MRTSLICAAVLGGTLAMAQTSPSINNQQQTSGVVGVAPGQTVRLNVLYPTAPAPILQPLCAATLNISDDQGNSLKSSSVAQFTAGKSVSLDFNADSELALRTEVHGFVTSPAGCNFIATLELIDNTTQKTVVVVGSRSTWPYHSSPAAIVSPPSR